MSGDALICSVLANIHRDKKKRPKPFSPADFLPKLDSEDDAPAQTPEQMYALLKVMFGDSSEQQGESADPQMTTDVVDGDNSTNNP